MIPKIRPMLLSDLDKIIKIEKELFPDAWTGEMFEEEINNQVSLVLELGNKIGGYICGWRLHEEFNITNVAVAKQFQKSGFGKLLVDYLLKNLEPEYKIIFLEVRAGNIAAQNLYKRSGFSALGIRNQYYKNPIEDAILMVLNLEKDNDER